MRCSVEASGQMSSEHRHTASIQTSAALEQCTNEKWRPLMRLTLPPNMEEPTAKILLFTLKSGRLRQVNFGNLLFESICWPEKWYSRLVPVLTLWPAHSRIHCKKTSCKTASSHDEDYAQSVSSAHELEIALLFCFSCVLGDFNWSRKHS